MKKYLILIIVLPLISNCTSVHFVPPSPKNFNLGEFGEHEKSNFAKEDTIAVVFMLTIREENEDKIIATVGTAFDEIKSSTVSFLKNKKYSLLPLYIDMYENFERRIVLFEGPVEKFTLTRNFRTFEQIDTLKFQTKRNPWFDTYESRIQQYETFRSSMISDIIIKYKEHLQKKNVQHALFLDITLENIIKETSYTQSTTRGYAVYGNKYVLSNRFRWNRPNLTILDLLNNKCFSIQNSYGLEVSINAGQTDGAIDILLRDIPTKNN